MFGGLVVNISGRDMSLDFSHTKFVEGIEERERSSFLHSCCGHDMSFCKDFSNYDSSFGGWP